MVRPKAMLRRPLWRRSSLALALALPILLGVAGCASLWGIGELPGLVTDGGADASGDAKVDAGPRFCTTILPKPDFCADFDDDETPVLSGFDNGLVTPDPFMTGGATITDERATFLSGPRAAAISLPQLFAGHAASAALVRSFETPPRSLLLEFAMRIDTEEFPDPTHTIGVAILSFPKGQLGVFRTETGLALRYSDDASTERIAKSSVNVPVGQWRRIGLVVVDRDTDKGTVALEIEGAQAAELPLGTTFTTESGRTYLGVGGIGAEGDFGAFKLTIDNLWMNVR